MLQFRANIKCEMSVLWQSEDAICTVYFTGRDCSLACSFIQWGSGSMGQKVLEQY